MSTPWTFEQRMAAYRREGITKIVVMPGASAHGRDDETGKTFGPVHGVTIHHTAGVGPGMPAYCRNGSPSLPGPLCHDFLAKDGTLYVVGHGRTNHAGTVTPAVAAELRKETPQPSRDLLEGTESVDGNDFLHGLEIENRGDGKDPYPAVQYDTAVRWAAAHCRFYGWNAHSAWGHKEITRRKVDPSFPMPDFRNRVVARLAPPTPAPTTPATGGTVPLRTSLSRPEGYILAAGQTKTIYWTVEHIDQPGDHGGGAKSVLTQSSFSAIVSLTVDVDIPTLVTVTPVREQEGTTARSALASHTVDVSPGIRTYAFPFIGDVADGWNLVFDVEPENPATITWAGLAMQSDPIA